MVKGGFFQKFEQKSNHCVFIEVHREPPILVFQKKSKLFLACERKVIYGSYVSKYTYVRIFKNLIFIPLAPLGPETPVYPFSPV